jgi:hypothetical protein
VSVDQAIQRGANLPGHGYGVTYCRGAAMREHQVEVLDILFFGRHVDARADDLSIRAVVSLESSQWWSCLESVAAAEGG